MASSELPSLSGARPVWRRAAGSLKMPQESNSFAPLLFGPLAGEGAASMTLDDVLAHLENKLQVSEAYYVASSPAPAEPPMEVRRAIRAAMDALGAWIDRFMAGQPSESEVAAAKARVTGLLRSWSHTGRLLDRALSKQYGYAGDFETVDIICDGQPSGADVRARLLDDYYLNMLISIAIRNRPAQLAAVLGQAIHERADLGHVPVQIMSLGSGPMRELLLLLDDPVFLQMTQVTCVDMRSEELRSARKRLRKALDGRVRYVRSGLLGAGRSPKASPDGFHIIYATWLFDLVSSDQAGQLIARCHSLLAPGGRLIVGQFSPRIPASDSALLGWLVENQPACRSEAQLRDLFAATPFGAGGLRFEYEPLGIGYLAIAERTP